MTVIAWRGQRRYVERLSRATLGARERDPVVRPDGSYIVTGGLGGFGMVVARWLVDSGAGRVVLNGRTGPSDEQTDGPCRSREPRRLSSCQGDIASLGSGRTTRGGRRRDRTAVARSRPLGGRHRRRSGGHPQQGKPGTCLGAQGGGRTRGCTKPPPTDSSTGGLAFPPWLRCWAPRGRRRTRARMRGSMPWWRGEEHRVCPPPRSIGASGRTSESPAR